MNTLKDLRQRIQPGVRVHIENHVRPQATRDCEVVLAQFREFSTTVPEPVDGWDRVGPRGSWSQYPPARDLRFDGESVTFLQDNGEPFITLTFLS